jgi:hypothetical protein
MRTESLKIIVRSLSLGFALSLMVGIQATKAISYDPASLYGYNYTRTDPAVFKSTSANERLRLKALADIERASLDTVHYDTKVKSDYMCDWSYDKVLGRYVCVKNYLKAYTYTHPTPVPVCPFGYKLDYGRTNCVPILVPTNAHYNSAGTGWECNPGYHINYTHSGCLGPEYVYKQCPGGSGSCSSSGCGVTAPCSGGGCTVHKFVTTTPVIAATPVIVQPIILVSVEENKSSDQPKPVHLPQTGPASLILWFMGSASAAAVWIRKRFSA